jgi:glycosyltransferase involved in cell wall biosynthesis
MLAFGFKTATKGWDLIKKIKVKEGWKIVVNGSKNHYNMERHLAEYASPSVIELHKGFLNDEDLSLLFFASDAIILPYKVTSGSGVMFDALAHSIPFISSDIGFFREFSDMGLGISVRRNPVEFSKALLKLEQNLDEYKMTIDKFRKNLLWEEVAKKHAALYDLVVKSPTLPC